MTHDVAGSDVQELQQVFPTACTACCVCDGVFVHTALEFQPDGSVTAMISEEGEKVNFAK